MKDQITIYSRSNNDVLFERMKGFIPEGYNVVKCDQFNEWWEAADYLYHIIDNCPTRWAINIDIDCFVYNWGRLLELIEYMDEGHISCYGMPDSVNYHPLRFHSPHTMNPFFNIFDVEDIRHFKEKDALCFKNGLSWEDISKTKVALDNGEPFHGFFQWIKMHNYPLSMTCVTEDDGMTTHGDSMLFHTWYSRMYGSPTFEGQYHTWRIDRWYNEAKRLAFGENK
jgi:hypothetical protein